MSQQMDARLTPYVPHPLFQETCRSWSRPPGQREHWPNVRRLRTDLQYEDGSISAYTSAQSRQLEAPRAPPLQAEKITEMTEVKNHKRPWMIPGVGLSPACLRSSPAKLAPQVVLESRRTITSPAVPAFRPSSSVYTRQEPNSPLCQQQAFWQTVFSSPQVHSPVHDQTTTTPQLKIVPTDCESLAIRQKQQHQDVHNVSDAQSSGGGSATTYFSDTSGIAYFLPGALSFTSSTRSSSMIKNSDDLFINTNTQSWDLGEWPSARSGNASELKHTGTSSPAVLDSAHSYGWWDVLRTPFLVNTPAVTESPASASGLAIPMAQAQADALKEVLLNVPSLASVSANAFTNDTSNVATFPTQKLDINSSEDKHNHHFRLDRPEPPMNMRSPPPRTTSLLADALSSHDHTHQPEAQYRSHPRDLLPFRTPLQPVPTHTQPSFGMDAIMPLPLQQQRRRPPLPMPISTAPTDSHRLHPFAIPLNQSIASPMFFHTVLNPSNEIDTHNNNNATPVIPRPERPPPLPPIPVTETFSTCALGAARTHLPPAPGSKQRGMFSNSLERVKRDRGRNRDRDRDLDGMDFCCRGIADKLVTLEFEPPPRVDRAGRRAAEKDISMEGARHQLRRRRNMAK